MDMIKKIKEKPKVNYDGGSDTLHILMKEGPEEEFIEVADGVIIELDTSGTVPKPSDFYFFH